MAKILDQPRYKCALAAMQTVHAIPGAIPVLPQDQVVLQNSTITTEPADATVPTFFRVLQSVKKKLSLAEVQSFVLP